MGRRRLFLWIYVVAAGLTVLGVMLQAFSIVAFVRGAGESALDMHGDVGLLIHLLALIVFLAALGAYWGAWKKVGLSFLLLVIVFVQTPMIGDTEESGGWINGLHGLLAIVVLLYALWLHKDGMRELRTTEPTPGSAPLS